MSETLARTVGNVRLQGAGDLRAGWPALIAAVATGGALGFSDAQIGSATGTAFPDVVQEGQGLDDDAGPVQATRDSTVEQVDLTSADGALRRLVFDHAGHFWPTRQYTDPQAILDKYGLRNQDIEGADQTWAFFAK